MDTGGDSYSTGEAVVCEEKAGDVVIAYRRSAVDAEESELINKEVVDRAIERLLLRTRPGLRTSGPITICVEHCEARRGHHDPLGEMRYLKVYVEGQGPSTIIAY